MYSGMAVIDLTASQAQPSAELAGPLRETRRVDTDPRRRVMRHDGHPCVDDRAAMTLVGHAGRSTAPQAGPEAFHDGSAVSTRIREIPLARGQCLRPVLRVQQTQDVLGRGRRGEGLDRLGDPHREHALLMPHCPQGGSMARHIAGQRADGRSGDRRHSGHGLLPVVDPGLPRAGVTGMADGQMQAKDTARGGRGDHPGFAATRGGAMTRPVAHGRHRGIGRVDDLAVGPRLALRESPRWVCEPVMRRERDRELGVQTRLRRSRQLRRTVQACLGGPRPRQDRLSQLQPWPLGLAPPGHTTPAPSPGTGDQRDASPAGARAGVAGLAPAAPCPWGRPAR